MRAFGFGLCILCLASACSSGGDPPANPPAPAAPNSAPTARAGADQAVIEGDMVSLSGTASSDADGTISSFTWTQTGGPAVVLQGANTAALRFATPDVTAPVNLTFQLSVIDNGGASANDSVAVAVSASDRRVFTAAGVIEGNRTGGGLGVFRGIRYANPPLGNLRWRAPEPVSAFSGVAAATAFGPNCFQIANVFAQDQSLTTSLSEDCLTLNIWTPTSSSAANLPVMVWIHGGGNNTGAGSQALFEGADLAEQENVVVVTLNYRLGPLGYLAHPLLSAESAQGVSGNYGLRDQILALRWIESNIAGFGGNRDLVTIIGESAGAVNVCNLIASPAAAGLFDRAIMQSGNCTSNSQQLNQTTPAQPESAASQGVRAAGLAGCGGVPDVLACLRALTPATLYSRLNPATGEFFQSGADFYGPIVDGVILPQAPLARLASGNHTITPLLIGSNSNEAGLFRASIALVASNLASYNAALVSLFGTDAPAVFALYPAANDAAALPAFERLFTDISFTCQARAAARLASAFSRDVWLYEFDRSPPALQSLGAFHGLEIGYVFGTIDAPTFQTADFALSASMQAYWAQFARGGDPNGAGRPLWPPFTVSGDTNQRLASTIGPNTGLRQVQCDLLESLD